MASITTFLVLTLCAVLSLAGTDLVLPSIPQLPAILGTSQGLVQMVLAAYTGGAALGLLLFGWLADTFKRRVLILISLYIFSCTSIACALASNIATLIALRLVQGAASSAVPVFGPEVMRQIFGEKAAVRAIGVLGSAESISPALAPILGAALLAHFGWKSSFVVLGFLSLIAAVHLRFVRFPSDDSGKSTRQGSYKLLLADPVFMRYALSQAMGLGGLLTFVFGAPSVLLGAMNASLNDFIIMQVVNVGSFVAAASLNSIVTSRIGIEGSITSGSTMMAASALAMLGYALCGGSNASILTTLFLPMGLGLGLRGPTAFYRGIVASGPNSARGSALITFLTLLATASSTAIAASFIHAGLPSLMILVSAMSLLSVTLLFLLPSLDPTVNGE